MRIVVRLAALGLALTAAAPAQAIGHWQGKHRALVVELDVVVTGAHRREFSLDHLRDRWDGVERL